ncbi:DUF3231 family protein [Paenibacillus psychroresistens]|uniref:DUF3231 family protein n=1 Tax=Paenibacillus psychroresistens TaxID=1778678 RepID=A0A6B8RLZ8_9BACL|nr:DUF3231 family protein [Paenibacillus psychroresistens]QGQ96682.1 DUF3231 family protein [Paenibacillus psychroresistens]
MATSTIKTEHIIKFTAAEIANLWSSYFNDTLAVCTITHFLAHIQDKEIETVLNMALDHSNTHIGKLKSFFNEEKLTVPEAFSIVNDVYPDAPRLFTDDFYLFYIQNIGKLGLATYTLALSNSARLDMCEYFTECLNESSALFNKATEILLKKGSFSRAPFIPDKEKVQFIEKQSYLGELLGKPRPLNVIEISNIYFNLIQNQLGKTLLIGFSQVAKSTKVREYMIRGREISDKHVRVFCDILDKEFLPSAGSWDSLATDSTSATFSDKLMMMHVTMLNSAGIGHYGMSIGTSARKDIGADFLRLMLEIVAFSEDGANLMIENSWLEQIPQAMDRDKLAENRD